MKNMRLAGFSEKNIFPRYIEKIEIFNPWVAIDKTVGQFFFC